MLDPSIFKAYDIRGIYPDSIDEEIAYKIGQAYVLVTKPKREIIVGNDVRIHSPLLKQNVIEGITDLGVDVVDVGLISTDMLYFAVGTYKTDGGIQITASHNPAEWNGMKMVKKNVIPINFESGIKNIKVLIENNKFSKSNKKGKVRKLDILDEYVKYLLSWIDTSLITHQDIVINPNFGYAGKVFERIIEIGKLPLRIIPLNLEPNGNFPKGRPDPSIPENREEFISLVKKSNADLGISWDADADRVFFSTGEGLFLEPYFLNTILVENMLSKYPNQKIIYDIRYTWALLDAIKSSGGQAILSRVGHSYIKEKMRSENALFAVESSGHVYYRDYWYSDCGMIPPLQVIEHLSKKKKNLSQIIKPVMQKYFVSGEINNDVKNVNKIMSELKEIYNDASINEIDGLAFEYKDYRFVVRPSNTEPLLRLTLESKSDSLMKKKRDEVLKIIKS